eukprot:6468647-Prymnesium_polylepis.1
MFFVPSRQPWLTSPSVTLPRTPPPSAELLTFCRERNGWCIYSATIWLALEYKGVPYKTVRELASEAPHVRWEDGSEQDDPLETLRMLDRRCPDLPLWPPPG